MSVGRPIDELVDQLLIWSLNFNQPNEHFGRQIDQPNEEQIILYCPNLDLDLDPDLDFDLDLDLDLEWDLEWDLELDNKIFL